MSETLRIHYQDPSIIESKKGQEFTDYVVTAVEMADRRFIRGRGLHDRLPEKTMQLSWEEEKAERVAEFYERYLAEKSQPEDGWNCHKFVVDVMGWEILWSDQEYPYYLSTGILAVKASGLSDETPYAVKGRLTPGSDKVLSHSMMGLPDLNHTLGAKGRNTNLWVMSHRTTERYGKSIYKQRKPLVQHLGRVAHILQPSSAAETFPR